MNKLSKMKSRLIQALKWLLKEWVKALLAAMAIFFLGFLAWIFRTYIRNWLAAKHSIEIFGWLWILVSFLVVSLPVLILWLFAGRKPLYKDDEDVRVMLEEQLERLSKGGDNEIRIDYRLWDSKLGLKKGSAAKFLPKIIENDSIFCMKNKGKETIVVRRKGLMMQVDADHPGGHLLRDTNEIDA